MKSNKIIRINKYQLFGFISVLWLCIGFAEAYNYETTTCTSSVGVIRVRWIIDMDRSTAQGNPIVVYINHGSGETSFTPNSISTNFQNLDSNPPFYITKMWSGDKLDQNKKSGEELVYKVASSTSNQSKWGLKVYNRGIVRPEIDLECHTDYQTKGPNSQNMLPWDSIDKLLYGVAFFLEDDVYTSNMLSQHNSTISYSNMYGRCYDGSNKDLVFWWDLNNETKSIKTSIQDNTFIYGLDNNYNHLQRISNNNGDRATYSVIYKASALFNPSLEFWEIKDGRIPGGVVIKIVQCKVGELDRHISNNGSASSNSGDAALNQNNKRPRVER